MSDNFVNDAMMSDPTLAAKIAAATSSEQIKEVLKQSMEQRGVIAPRQRGDAATVHINHNAQAQLTGEVPLSASGFKFERELRFAPESGKRTLILRANSEADLDALEAQILHY
jgi:2-phospho-L-lactate guanylyltransferase (CobY/MobA/RfbA family)